MALVPTINGQFKTRFELDTTPKNLLHIKNNQMVNRPLVTQDQLKCTGFSAILSRVQYGTYQNKPACLLAIDFRFRFRSKALWRYTNADIEVMLKHASDVTLPEKPDNNQQPRLDPKVRDLAPREVYGIVKTVHSKRYLDVTMPILFENPIGVQAGLTGRAGMESTLHAEHRMELRGEPIYDDDHVYAANGVRWTLSENGAQKDGIFRAFTGVVILEHPPEQAMWVWVIVKPTVKFSINPARFFQKNEIGARLMQKKKDEPILLDGKTPLDGQAEILCDHFDSRDFPWRQVMQIPSEYENHIHLDLPKVPIDAREQQSLHEDKPQKTGDAQIIAENNSDGDGGTENSSDNDSDDGFDDEAGVSLLLAT